MLKSSLVSMPLVGRTGVCLEQAGSDLEKIVAQSLRQAPPMEAPLMAWPVVCGSAVAERTHALTFVDGVLRVAVPDAGWRSELQALAPRYLAGHQQVHAPGRPPDRIRHIPGREYGVVVPLIFCTSHESH